MNDHKLDQRAGNQSTNLQGHNVNIYNGITYTDAKEIFEDLFEANFLNLKHESAEIAKKRAEEITTNFLDKLSTKSPESISEFKEPAMQDALFNVQKEYAKSGDSDLGDLLVDILVDRAQVKNRNMMQLVLDESLKVASSLTVQQLDTLTLIFLLAQTRSLGIKDYDGFSQMIDEDFEPFVTNLVSDSKQYNYLEYQRCGHLRAGSYGDLEKLFLEHYKGFFSKGITIEEIEKQLGQKNNFDSLFMPCFHNNNLYQIAAYDDNELQKAMNELNVPDSLRKKYKKIFNQLTMRPQEVKELLIKTNPCMNKIFETWNNSRIKKFELSSVGIAIAHANYKRRTGQKIDLSIWIN